MRNRFLLGILIVIIIVGIAIFINKSRKQPQHTAPTIQSQSTSSAVQPSGTIVKPQISK